jgi:cell division protein FtsZ
MSTFDISRQAAGGIGELAMPTETDGALALETTEAPWADEPQPAVDAKPFIAPAPQLPPRRPEPAARPADAFRASDLVNAAPRPEPARSRGPSLFRQITGLGLKAERAEPAAPARAEAARPTAAQQPTTQPVGQPAGQTAAAAQPRLGALHPSDRVRPSQSDDEMLDIPAFLRRQAN